MSTTGTNTTQRSKIQIYFLAAPEDQDICEEIQKHLAPIVKSSLIPIEVNSDFNVPVGGDREKHKQRLLDADVVLALISVDFIDDNDVYNRNQKVIDRYNKHETIMIPILIRNFMWKSTPFRSLPVLPKNLQPLNNKQFWNSQDDAVMAVVSEIYDSINELAQSQSETMQPASVAEVESAPDLKPATETPASQAEPDVSISEIAQTPSETVQPSSVAEVESAPDLGPATETPASQAEPDVSINEIAQTPSDALQPVSDTEEVESAPDLKAPARTPIGQTTSQARESTPIAVDWRKKYYRTVVLKRAGAILLDQFFLLVLPVIVYYTVFPGALESDSFAGELIIFLSMYFIVAPIMESSKWQGTIGKRILKLQITDREGERITFLRAFWRNIIRTIVLYLYIVTWGILLIAQYIRFNKTKKLFQDEFSGTVIGDRLASSGEPRVTATVA